VLENCRGHVTVCKLEHLCPKKAPSVPASSDISWPTRHPLLVFASSPTRGIPALKPHDFASPGITNHSLDYILPAQYESMAVFTLLL